MEENVSGCFFLNTVYNNINCSSQRCPRVDSVAVVVSPPVEHLLT